MPSPPNITNITPPRVSLVDERTGLISREWYRFFLSLFNLTGGGNNTASLTDLQLGPPTPQQEDLTDIIIDVEATKIQPTEESANEQIAELAKQVQALAVLPLTSWVLSEIAELQTQIDGLLAASSPPVNFLTNGASILYGDNLGGFSNVTIGSGVSFSGGTLSATGSGGTVTAVTGVAPITSTGGTTPAIGVTAAALTKVDDTNVTLTLGGTPATSLLAATSLTLGWAGQLAVSRGGTGVATATANTVFAGPTTGAAAAPSFRSLVSADIPALSYVTSVGATAPITSTGGLTPTIGVTAAALTKTDDTNVTLTLGGSPTTALLAATSLTLGWSGTLATTRGGTGQSTYTNGELLIGNTTGNTLTKSTLTAGAGISIANGAGSITIAGSGALTASAPVTATSNYIVVDGVTFIINNKTGSSLTVTLPTASSYSGRILTIQNYQAQTVISASSNVVPQGGGAAGTAILDNVVGNWATLVSNGTNWVIMTAAAFNNLLLE